MKKHVLVLFLLLASYAADARYWTGNDIYKWLNNPADISEARMYIMGIADAEEVSRLFAIAQQENFSGKTKFKFFCIPDGVTGEQLADVVRQYLKENPKNRHGDAAMLVRLGLIDTWPCMTNN